MNAADEARKPSPGADMTFPCIRVRGISMENYVPVSISISWRHFVYLGRLINNVMSGNTSRNSFEQASKSFPGGSLVPSQKADSDRSSELRQEQWQRLIITRPEPNEKDAGETITASWLDEIVATRRDVRRTVPLTPLNASGGQVRAKATSSKTSRQRTKPDHNSEHARMAAQEGEEISFQRFALCQINQENAFKGPCTGGESEKVVVAIRAITNSIAHNVWSWHRGREIEPSFRHENLVFRSRIKKEAMLERWLSQSLSSRDAENITSNGERSTL